jgi:DnaJ-class molecular chaperone
MAQPTPHQSPGDQAPPGVPGTGENTCRACKGTGKVNGKTCGTCEGTGKVIEGIGGG